MIGQQHPVTVGDTLTVSQLIAVPHDAIVQPREIVDSATATPIGPPVVTREGDSVRIAYTIAVWAPGHSMLTLPGALLVDGAGRVDTLASTSIPLDVSTVLPAGAPASIRPRAASPWVPHLDRSDLPFAVLVPLALICCGLLQWWWRRPGKPPVAVPNRVTGLALDDRRVEGWLAAGESRLVIDQVEALVRDRPDCADWCARADAIRFAPGDGAAFEALAREGWSRVTGRHS